MIAVLGLSATAKVTGCKSGGELHVCCYHVGRSGGERCHSKAMASCQIFLVVSMI